MFVWLIQYMLIHLIRDHINVIFLRQISNHHQFLSCENLSAGIGRIAKDQRLYPLLLHGCLQLIRIKVKGRGL